MLMLNYACDGGGCASRKPCPVCGKEPTATPIENSFYSYAELTEEQKIRFAAYQVFDVPKKASSNIKDTDSGKPEAEEEQARWVMVSERLSEDGETVFVIIHDGFERFENGNEVARLTYLGNGNWWAWESERYVVTHWMPLPNPPEAK